MGIANYKSRKFPTPEILQGAYSDGYSSVLIIGTGESTSKLLKHKDKIREHFDVVIGVNHATKDFEDIMDFHIIMEKNPVKMAEDMSPNNYRKDLPRILNYKALDHFPDDMIKFKARREQFFGRPDITKYTHLGVYGLLEYNKPGRKRKLFYGTVITQAIHFACILGLKNIYLIGADLMFKGDFDHYYKDKFYRNSTSPARSQSPIIEVKKDGKMITTLHVFKKSAKYIDKTITRDCRPKGIKVHDFSDGLIKAAVSLDVDEFFAK